MATDDGRIDEEGRVRLPESVREAAGLEPGSAVRVSLDGSVVRIACPGTDSERIDRLEGCITDETVADGSLDPDALELEGLWIDDLPTDGRDS